MKKRVKVHKKKQQVKESVTEPRHTTIETGPPDPEKLKNGFVGKVKQSPLLEYSSEAPTDVRTGIKISDLKPPAQIVYWKKRSLEAEELLNKKIEQVKILEKGQITTADNIAPGDVEKMSKKIHELEERLAPFSYEFVIDNMLFKVIVRPRTKEVIPVTT